MTDRDTAQDAARDAAQDSAQDSADSGNRLFGRRKGRPLRKRRTEMMQTLLPKLELPLPPDGVRLEPTSLFGKPVRDVWLEIGFGSGHHLAWQAENHPDVGLIGAEPFVNGVAALLTMADDRKLDNLRIVSDDARPLLDALPDAAIGRAFVLFADPWPKKRHWERRFIGPDNLPRLARVLKDGAELRLASDDMGLVRWMLEHTVKHPDFEWTARGPSDWRTRTADWPPTRYEEKAIAAGRKPVFLRFVRKSRA